MNKIKWTKISKMANEEGMTITYQGEGTPYSIESRLRHIPHANRSGTWDHTTYVVVKDGQDLFTRYSLADAKEFVENILDAEANMKAEKEQEAGGEKIRVIYKRCDFDPVEIRVPNTLQQFQDMVGGYIETVMVGEDWIVLCDEEGRLKDRPWNCEVCGIDFCGPVVFVGVKGEEFADLPMDMDVFRSLFPDLWEEDEFDV